MIAGGYYLKARKTQESWIAHAPPHVREIWDWLLLNANYEDHKEIKRGQCFTSYNEIREGLHWMVGYRKERYSKWDCEKAMKVLTKATMVATTKTTRGLIITILNYDIYQNPKNYESHNDSHTRATRKPQGADTIRKEEEEGKEVQNKEHTRSKPYSSEPEQTNGSEPPVTPLFSIPLVDKTEHPVTQTDIDQWQEVFPAVDVLSCLKYIRQWNLDNPGKRKTARGIRKHISEWLRREQDKGGGTFKRTTEKAGMTWEERQLAQGGWEQ